MSKITLTGFMLLLLLLLGNSSGNYAAQSKQKTSGAPTGTLQKMIVENGSVTMDLDLSRLNGISFAPQKAVKSFWYLTICCADLSRVRWHWSHNTQWFFPLR